MCILSLYSQKRKNCSHTLSVNHIPVSFLFRFFFVFFLFKTALCVVYSNYVLTWNEKIKDDETRKDMIFSLVWFLFHFDQKCVFIIIHRFLAFSAYRVTHDDLNYYFLYTNWYEREREHRKPLIKAIATNQTHLLKTNGHLIVLILLIHNFLSDFDHKSRDRKQEWESKMNEFYYSIFWFEIFFRFWFANEIMDGAQQKW